jgi:hypothetical protein
MENTRKQSLLEKNNAGGAYLLRRLVAKADASADGHLTVMKFTTNWRVGLGTPANREDVYRMPQGATFREAAEAASEKTKPASERGNGRAKRPSLTNPPAARRATAATQPTRPLLWKASS